MFLWMMEDLEGVPKSHSKMTWDALLSFSPCLNHKLRREYSSERCCIQIPRTIFIGCNPDTKATVVASQEHSLLVFQAMGLSF